MHMRATDIAAWLKNRLAVAGAHGFVVALTGDVDSAVVAALCRMAAADRVLGVILPCGAASDDETDAQFAADQLGISSARIDLSASHASLTTELTRVLMARHSGQTPGALQGGEIDLRAPFDNVETRLRMTSLYFFANSLQYLVAGSANRCELAIGNVAKFGDAGVDVFPIGHLLGSEVRALARDVAVPDRLIDKPRASGEWIGRREEGDGGFTHADLERYLGEGPEGVPPATALRIERLMRQTEHKRAMPAIPGEAAPEKW
jgi:NAD+ synthase